MKTRALHRSALAALVIGLAAGTAAAQGAKGAYGGASYGGASYGGAPAPAAPVAAEPAPAAAPTPAPVEAAPPEPAYETPSVTEAAPTPPFYERWGLAMTIGGGPEGFSSRTNTSTQIGGGWNVRAILGNKSYLGVEASYVGSAQGFEAAGMDKNAVLVGSGVGGALRLNFAPKYALGPFIFGGAGWRHYSLTNASYNNSGIKSTDNVAEFPIGGGLQYIYGGLLVDARLDYRFTQNGNMMPAASNTDMGRWGIEGNIGYQF
ncbi:MAG: hypothetical protein ACM31C_06215 [Acidobacteriota bacterium]